MRFGLGNPLHTMHARLKFHGAIYICTRYLHDDFFESTCSTFTQINNTHFPPLAFAVFGVHPIQVSSKNRCLVPTCTRAEFHNDVFRVLRVFGDQHKANGFFKFWKLRFDFLQLLFCHISHFWIRSIRDDFFCFLLSLGQIEICSSFFHQGAQIFVLPIESDIAFLVGDDIGLNYQIRNFVETLLYNGQTVDHWAKLRQNHATGHS